MATYGELQDNLASYFNRSDLSATIQLAIKRAVLHYEREQFWFTETDDKFIGVSGTSAYTLSATNGYAQINQVLVNYNGSRYEVNRTNMEQLNALSIVASSGIPSVYAEEGGVLHFHPTPNATMTFSYNFQTKYATLSATADYNAITVNAPDLIESRAGYFIATQKTRDTNLANIFKTNEMEALARVREDTTQKMASGKIEATSF